MDTIQVKKMKKGLILVFCLLCLGIPVQMAGQVLNLNVPWKFIQGDQPGYASPSFDDALWKTIAVDKIWEASGYDPYDGYAWYRIRVVIPSSLKKMAPLKDSLRLYLMFLGPLEAMKPWNPQGIEGVHRFLQKVWREFIGSDGNVNPKVSGAESPAGSPPDLTRLLHETVKKVGEDMSKKADEIKDAKGSEADAKLVEEAMKKGLECSMKIVMKDMPGAGKDEKKDEKK